MAIISNFELLFKPIAPVAGPASEIGRLVAQGYFLEISNLENRDITLILRTRTPVRDAADSPNTEFTSTNNVVVYDITADNVFETTMTSAGEQIAGKQLGHSVVCMVLPAGQTASVAILPDASNLLSASIDDLAIRGYVELILSSNIDSFIPLVFSDPQSARVLVSAEHRGTFIDQDFDPTDFSFQSDLDFDQLAYSLSTANGKALQLINTHAPCNDPFQDLLTSDAILARSDSNVNNLNSGSINSLNMKKDLSLRSLSRNLNKEANSPKRSLSFKFGAIPVTLDYSIIDGKYVVDEKSLMKSLNLVRRRKKMSKKEIDFVQLSQKINKALSGDKRADDYVSKVLENLLK